MLRLILVGVTAAIVSCLITTLFFVFKIYRKFARWMKNEERMVAVELSHVQEELQDPAAQIEKECGTNEQAKE